MINKRQIDALWDDNPVDVTSEANFIWSIANKLRGTYMPDKYGDVIIPMTILRRFECALAPTKAAVIEIYEKNPTIPTLALERKSGFQFYNTSQYDLKELQNESDKLAENFNNYIEGFSSNVQDIMKQLKLADHIKTMDDGGCLLTVVKAFSELDLNPATYDSIKMGYIFENLIGRFYQNVDAGQYYTGRDIIKCLVSILTAEGSDDIFEDHKVITVCDQACGTGGMLSTAYSYLKHVNPSADVRLFGQEYMGPSYAIGLAEMLIKGQDAKSFRHADTFKEDCFKDTKMRFVIENPPFGTPWSGKDAKEGQEKAVRDEFAIIVVEMPSANKDSISERLEKLKIELIKSEKDLSPVTISAGITFSDYEGENKMDVFRQADKALYFAKNHGRNSYSFYDELNKDK